MAVTPLVLPTQNLTEPVIDTRLNILNMDALDWVKDVSNLACAQALNVDLYDQDAAVPVLDDESFYQACYGVLADAETSSGGLMSVNLFGRAASFMHSLELIVNVFGRKQVWHLQPTGEGNTIVVAAREVALPRRSVLAERARYIETQLGLRARKWLRIVQETSPTKHPA